MYMVWFFTFGNNISPKVGDLPQYGALYLACYPFDVFILHSKDNQVEVGVDSRGFLMERRGPWVETSFSNVVYRLLKQK